MLSKILLSQKGTGRKNMETNSSHKAIDSQRPEHTITRFKQIIAPRESHNQTTRHSKTS